VLVVYPPDHGRKPHWIINEPRHDRTYIVR
jgi:hypothetical protein